MPELPMPMYLFHLGIGVICPQDYDHLIIFVFLDDSAGQV